MLFTIVLRSRLGSLLHEKIFGIFPTPGKTMYVLLHIWRLNYNWNYGATVYIGIRFIISVDRHIISLTLYTYTGWTYLHSHRYLQEGHVICPQLKKVPVSLSWRKIIITEGGNMWLWPFGRSFSVEDLSVVFYGCKMIKINLCLLFYSILYTYLGKTGEKNVRKRRL